MYKTIILKKHILSLIFIGTLITLIGFLIYMLYFSTFLSKGNLSSQFSKSIINIPRGQGIAISGTTLRGHVNPTCPAQEPCLTPQPIIATITVRDIKTLHEITHVQSDKKGNFTVSLEQGKYFFQASSPQFGTGSLFLIEVKPNQIPFNLLLDK